MPLPGLWACLASCSEAGLPPVGSGTCHSLGLGPLPPIFCDRLPLLSGSQLQRPSLLGACRAPSHAAALLCQFGIIHSFAHVHLHWPEHAVRTRTVSGSGFSALAWSARMVGPAQSVGEGMPRRAACARPPVCAWMGTEDGPTARPHPCRWEPAGRGGRGGFLLRWEKAGGGPARFRLRRGR